MWSNNVLPHGTMVPSKSTTWCVGRHGWVAAWWNNALPHCTTQQKYNIMYRKILIRPTLWPLSYKSIANAMPEMGVEPTTMGYLTLPRYSHIRLFYCYNPYKLYQGNNRKSFSHDDRLKSIIMWTMESVERFYEILMLFPKTNRWRSESKPWGREQD